MVILGIQAHYKSCNLSNQIQVKPPILALESRNKLLAATTEQMANQVGEGASFRKGLQDYESMVHVFQKAFERKCVVLESTTSAPLDPRF